MRVQSIISWLLCIIYMLSFYKIQSQPQEFRNLSTEDGLSQSVITCLYQDAQGFIWIGTQNGLNKYDGYEFTTFRNEELEGSISDNYIRTIYEDKKGTLWIGTDANGLNRYDKQNNRFTSFYADEELGSLPNNTILSLAEDNKSLLIGTKDGLFAHNSIDLTFTEIPLEDSISLTITALFVDSEENLWIGTEYGLALMDSERNIKNIFFHDEKNDSSLSNNNIHFIYQTDDDDIYIGTNHGLNQYNPETESFTRYHYQADEILQEEKNEFYALAEFKNHLWIGTFGGGLIHYDLQKDSIKLYKNEPNDPHSLSNNYVISLLVDRSGVLWAGTYGGGLSLLPLSDIHFGEISVEKCPSCNLSSNEVYAITTDLFNNIWIGTDNGLTMLDNEMSGNTFKSDDAEGNLSSDVIYSLLADKNGSLWVGTSGGGLCLLPAKKLKKGDYHFETLLAPEDAGTNYSRNDIFSILQDNNDNIWVGTSDGIVILDNHANYITTLLSKISDKTTLSDPTINCMLSLGNHVWVGTSGGLNKVNISNKSVERIQFADQPQFNSLTIYSLYADGHDNIWLGTDNRGLIKYDPVNKTTKIYTTKDGLPDNVIYGILCDKDGFLWVSTNHGLAKIKTHRGTEKLSIDKFTKNDYLHSHTFNIGASHQGNNGYYYFGGSDGIVYFNEDMIRGNNFKPPVYLTEFQLFYEIVEPTDDNSSPLKVPISETKRLVLNHNQNVISFEFAALNYLNSHLNKYAYKMEGFDPDWRFSRDNRMVTYTNLDDGKYTFRVIASNNTGIWNEEGVSLEIVIKPPFTKTIWFYALLITVVTSSFFLILHIRTQRFRKVKQLLEREVALRTNELSETNLNLEVEIIERKKIENELKDKNVELNKTLENLRKTQSQLIDSEKMASLGQLTAGVAHEINNPINFVSGNITPLARDIDDILDLLKKYEEIIEQQQLSEKFQEVEKLKAEIDYSFLLNEIHNLLDGMREGASRTASIVKGLRNFSRLDETDFKQADIHEGIESTLLILQNKLKGRIEVIKEYDTIPTVMCYPGQLNQVFMNILTNAIQAIEDKGTITIKTTLNNDRLVIKIKDSGAGMPEEVRQKIFDPFFTTKDVGQGTGLGLSISYGIIEKHNGTIEVESEPGKGTEFIITIPLQQ